jgi:hypothetical protein
MLLYDLDLFAAGSFSGSSFACAPRVLFADGGAFGVGFSVLSLSVPQRLSDQSSWEASLMDLMEVSRLEVVVGVVDDT